MLKTLKPKAGTEIVETISQIIVSLPKEMQIPALLGIARLIQGKGFAAEGRRDLKPGDEGYNPDLKGLNHLITLPDGTEVVNVIQDGRPLSYWIS